jgi:hypothetical protein
VSDGPGGEGPPPLRARLVAGASENPVLGIFMMVLVAMALGFLVASLLFFL